MNCRKNKLLLIILWLPLAMDAQDTHYWGNQYGPGGFFVPGATVAFIGDSAALFYNPALLVHAGGNKIAANATAYFYEKIKIKNGAGTNFHLQSLNTGSSPLLVTGNIQFKKHPRINLAYGLISEPVFDYEVNQRRDQQFQVLDDSYSPGAEFYVGQMQKQNSIRRFAAMAGMGFPLSKKISVGFYVEGHSRRQRYELNFIGRALVNPPGNTQYPLVSTDFDYFASHTHYGLKGRIGVAYDNGPDHIGVTIQTPLMRLGGSGTIMSDMVVNNGNLLGMLINFIANARQEKLKAVWKEPFSVALGYSRQLQRATFYAAAEYFPAIDEYTMLMPRPEFFIRPDTGNNNLFTQDILKLKDARKSVLNISAGASFYMNQRMNLFVALRTDNTYYSREKFKDNDGFIPYIASWNSYHLQTGVNLKKQKYNMRVGVYLSYGSNNQVEQDINFDNPNEGNFLQGQSGMGKATAVGAGLLLSYIHNF